MDSNQARIRSGTAVITRDAAGQIRGIPTYRTLVCLDKKARYPAGVTRPLASLVGNPAGSSCPSSRL